jgi:hypothetical protein
VKSLSLVAMLVAMAPQGCLLTIDDSKLDEAGVPDTPGPSGKTDAVVPPHGGDAHDAPAEKHDATVLPHDAGVDAPRSVRDAGSDHASATPDAGHDSPGPTHPDAACWDGASPSEVTFEGAGVSMSEIVLHFTSGPPYSLTRKITGLPDEPAYVLGSLPPCSRSFTDHGQSGGDGTEPEGGLIPNWDYTYRLTVLVADGGPDLRFDAMTLTVQTWNASDAPSVGSDGGTLEQSSHGD